MKNFFITRNENKIIDGVEFSNGKCVLCWLSEVSSLIYHENIENVIKIHCNSSYGSSELIYY